MNRDCSSDNKFYLYFPGHLCDYCCESGVNINIGHVPRPMPDTNMHYLDVDSTPLCDKNGCEREVDDFHPRVQIRRLLNNGNYI